MKIAMIGGGQASIYHLRAYSKIYKENPFFSIDLFIEPDPIAAIKWVDEFHNLFPTMPLPIWYDNINQIKDLSNHLVDICCPNHLHFNAILESQKLGCNKVIVEKPAVVTKKQLATLKKLKIDIYLQENYMFSPILTKVSNFIRDNNINIDFIKCNFSKNRVNDSMKSRGFYHNMPPHILMIEMPHSISVAYFLLGQGESIYAESHDMILPKRTLNNHGSGMVIISHNGKLSYHYSSMVYPKKERTMIIFGRDSNNQRIKIISNFALSGNDNLGKNIYVQNGKVIKEEKVIDDSLTVSLYKILNAFKTNSKLPVDMNFIEDTTLLILDATNFANDYKVNKLNQFYNSTY